MGKRGGGGYGGDLGGGGSYREEWAASSTSVSEWPGGPAKDCERCARWGKVALKSSKSFPSGFCEFCLGKKRLAEMAAWDATRERLGGCDRRPRRRGWEQLGRGKRAHSTYCETLWSRASMATQRSGRHERWGSARRAQVVIGEARMGVWRCGEGGGCSGQQLVRAGVG